MKDVARLTKAELIERLKTLESAASGEPHDPAESALRDAGERLRAILETAAEGIITIDDHGVIESLNPAAEQVFGYQPGELVGKNVSALMPSPDCEQHDGYLASYHRTGRAKIIGIGREVVGRRKDGSVFPMDLAVSEVRLAGRRLFTGFVRDISERKRAEAQVRLVQSVIEHGFSAVLILNGEFPDPHIVYANPAFAQRTGYAPEKVIGQPLSTLSNLSALHDRLRQGVAEGQRFWEEAFPIQTPQGERWGEWRVGPVRDPGGQVTHWLAILRDISERKRLEKEILDISDREQRRIGQDLHDGLCQHLAGIELMSQVVAQKLAAKSKAASARVGEVARHVREAIGQTRLLARGLSPVTLESEGLMSGLQELASNTEKMFGVACAFECKDPVLLDDPAAATHLYRIAQEAVSNAIKHGKARHIRIRLNAVGTKCVLMVKDDGVGLPKILPNNEGMGLRIMEYRAGIIGGALMVERDLDGGTSVVCSVPRGSGPERANPS